MNFKYYDLLSSLVSGILIAVSINYLFDLRFGNDAIPLLAVSYVIGYFVNAISALMECFYYRTMGGKPSDVLLTLVDGQSYTGYKRIKFYDAKRVIDSLKEELNDPNASAGKMFGRAMSYSNDDSTTRVPDFNAQYAFSRVVLTTSLILSVLWLMQYSSIWWLWLIALAIIILAWKRCKERGYYYAKEVLTVYLKKKQTNEKQ